jgi:hypothetical protein
VRLAVITAILASAALIAAPAALADGDPASDVLANAALFNPIGSGVSLGQQAQLEAVLADSKRAGFPIRVALIASGSAGDLGTVTALWEQPGTYAQYLDLELSELYDGQVLVVMPNGFGLDGPASGPHKVGAAEAAVRAPAPGPGAQLAASAIAAVPLLARAAGHPIPASELSAATHSATLGEKSAAGRSFSPSAVIALTVGLLLIAAAWWASLHARPLERRRRLQP